ncbi:MAG: isochorismatase family protein [Burkholderiaceae bacterium]
MKTALLVIDAQESFRHRPYFQPVLTDAYLTAQNALIRGAQARSIPLVRIFHSDGPDTPDNPFALSSGHVSPLNGLSEFDASGEFLKHRHSALVGTGLDVWLVQNGIRRLIISGIRTEQCCETTTRHASDLGWEIDFVPEATLTFDMTQPNGSPLTAAEIKARTVTVLNGRFCTVTTADEALARAEAAA